MTFSDLSFVAKVVLVSGAMGAAIKYLLPLALANFPAGQNHPALATVVVLLLAPSALMGLVLGLGRGEREPPSPQ